MFLNQGCVEVGNTPPLAPLEITGVLLRKEGVSVRATNKCVSLLSIWPCETETLHYHDTTLGEECRPLIWLTRLSEADAKAHTMIPTCHMISNKRDITATASCSCSPGIQSGIQSIQQRVLVFRAAKIKPTTIVSSASRSAGSCGIPCVVRFIHEHLNPAPDPDPVRKDREILRLQQYPGHRSQ